MNACAGRPPLLPLPSLRCRPCSVCFAACPVPSAPRQYIIDRRTFFEAELEASSQSRVGEKLTELTIRKVNRQFGD